MKGDIYIMDENTPVQQNTDPRQSCLKLMNTLLATLTVFEREVKMAHWNLKSESFRDDHLFLDVVHDDVCECIDTLAEEIRKGDFYPAATLAQCLQNSTIQELQSVGPCTKAMAFNMLATGLNAVRVLADSLSTMADESKFWTIQDVANGILSKMNHHLYFVKNTILDDDEDD